MDVADGARNSGHHEVAVEMDAGDPCALVRALERDEGFRRDTGLGAIYHPGKLSFREVRPTDSLHIIIDGNRISAHVDDISPFKRGRDGTVRYSLSRIVAHNLSGISADFARLVSGRLGQHRCRLECDQIWVDEDGAS